MKKALSIFILALVLLISSCGGHVNHRVSKGDTLYSIGWKYGQDYRDIARWNSLQQPFTLSQGQWLRVAPPLTEWWETEYPERRRKLPPPIAIAPSPRPTHVQISPDEKVSMVPASTQKKSLKEDDEDMPDWQWPIRGKVKINTGKQKGIDIYGKEGQPVYAAAEGRVVYSGDGL
ncbi:MAG: LysM peptidoglycan-binding domain-containing protein, partial [Gammaproteobacteria bacterium]|nr:LysM peptidoglycan-binding domain-containing protein [Gammaproteobacteria bacterium]